MQFRVVVVQGPDTGREFLIKAGQTLTVGRGDSAATRLTDPSISRQHCRLELNDDHLLLTDTDSGTGTFLNDASISQAVLRHGDCITLGDTDLRVEDVETDADRTIAPRRQIQASTQRDFSFLPGCVVHRYRIAQELVKGQTGAVFLALNVDTQEPVALKVLWPDIAREPDEKRRFVRAMKTMQPIRHPGIVRIFNAGITELTVPRETLTWYAMEFVDGPSLSTRIERIGTAGMVDWQEAWNVAVDIAQALQVAYEHGIVHRNITPDNILISSSQKTAKLGDLMLAKALEGAGSEPITRAGQLLGDVAFMSPERSRGEPGDHRSDLYSLGATLYAMLTGQTPFDAPTIPAMLHRIQNDSDTPLPPHTFQLSINEHLEGVVLKLLSRNPARRYETPALLLEDLDRIGRCAGLIAD